MYLYYYLNEKYVGTVDIEVFFELKQKKSLITCTQEAEDLLAALELMYGKSIQRDTLVATYHFLSGPVDHRGQYRQLPPHVFLTKKMGKQLQWSEWSGKL